MNRKSIENAVAIAGGLGLGALAMYLLDPKQGRQRRANLAASASHAASHTREAAEATLHQVGRSARTATGRAAHYARDLADRVIDEVESRAHDLAHSAHDVVDHVSDTAHDAAAHSKRLAKVGSMASGMMSGVMSRLASHKLSHGRESMEDLRAELAERVRHAAGAEESHPVAEFTGHTLGTFGFLLVGAGSMYFLDPARGRARRAWIGDKVGAIVRRTGRRARGWGHHLSNKSQGYYARARSAVPEPWKPAFMREQSTESPQQSMPVAPQAR